MNQRRRPRIVCGNLSARASWSTRTLEVPSISATVVEVSLECAPDPSAWRDQDLRGCEADGPRHERDEAHDVVLW